MRFRYQKHYENDCITVCDEKEELKTSFDSEIILFPMEDSINVIDELNVQCAVVDMLVRHLEMYEDPEDIRYWIDEVREDFE